MTAEKFLNYEPGLDSFSKTNIICNQKICSRHLDGAGDRVELVVFNLYSTPIGSKKRSLIGQGRCAPAQSVEKCLEGLGGIESLCAG